MDGDEELIDPLLAGSDDDDLDDTDDLGALGDDDDDIAEDAA